ncbi:MAG TPA: hypothetical protein VNS88_00020 [Nitrospiraceae bacterium]|nr:hypothetical protein [Nitrospiraceae bacterium]
MNTTVLTRPSKIEQAAALMLTVFKENPNAVMTRREVESLVNVSEFSNSTRQRALWHLCSEKHIRYEWNGGAAARYWMPAETKKED